MFENDECDPITLEPLKNSKRVMVITFKSSKVYYDFDNFYQNFYNLKGMMPHTNLPFTYYDMLDFNQTCKEFGVAPIHNTLSPPLSAMVMCGLLFATLTVIIVFIIKYLLNFFIYKGI